jgi:uncharacterized protein with NRDE domain
MCLVAFELNDSPQATYCFVLAANRDEYFARPSSSANWWPHTSPALFAGKDLQAGGTWMGVNRLGQIAFVTNWRSGTAPESGLPSRGAWTVAALQEKYLDTAQLQRLMQQSGPGNLVVGNVTDPNSFIYLAQREKQARQATVNLQPANYGLSNGSLNDPWPKTSQLKTDLNTAVASSIASKGRVGRHGAEQALIQALMNALSRPEKYEDALLPSTGVSVETERMLSSAWIDSETYGTRTSTVILAQKNGRCVFVERSRDGVISQTEFTVRSALSQTR